MPTDAVADGSTATQDASADANQQEEEFVFDKWFDDQPEKVKAGVEGHVAGLKTALKSERDGRTATEKQLRALSKTAEEGSKLKEELDRAINELSEERVKNQFYLDASAAKVTNVKLAWLAAKAEDLIDSRGNVDLRALRESNPELFAPAKTPIPSANQGNGRDQSGERKATMNDAIREAAGRNIR